MPIRIFPAPAQLKYFRQKLSLPKRRYIRLSMGHSENFIERLREFSQERPFPLELSYGSVPDDEILINVHLAGSAATRLERYEISTNEAGFHLTALTETGLFRGLCSLAQYIDQNHLVEPTQAAYIAIEDTPDFANRGVMLDISRCKVPSLKTLKQLIKQFARLKYNQLQLYTEHTFKFQNHPLVWAEASPLDASEILELKHFAAAHYIELVPNLNCFGHFERWLRYPEYHQYAECPDGFIHPLSNRKMPFGSTLYPNKNAQKLIDSLHAEYLPLFDSAFFNIGGDEPWELGVGRSAKRCEAEGKTNVYIDFLSDIQKLVEKRGRQMMFWSDIVLKQPESLKRLSKDSIAMNWGYESNHPFREEAAHMADHNIPFYVCPGTSSWTTLTGRTKNMHGNIASAAKQGKEHDSVGLLVTDWGDNGHHQYLPISYPGFAVGACESWRQGSTQRKHLPELVNRFFLEEPDTHTAECILDLGTVLEEAKNPLRNATIFNQLVFWSLRREPANTKKLTREQLQSCLDRFEGIKNDLRSSDPLVNAELNNAISAASHGVNRLLHHRYDTVSREQLRTEIAAVKGEHERLWLARNRHGGLRESMSHLERAEEVL